MGDEVFRAFVLQGEISTGPESCRLPKIDWVIHNVRACLASNSGGLVRVPDVNADFVNKPIQQPIQDLVNDSGFVDEWDDNSDIIPNLGSA
jgi:hypothetical protein